jgi:hypothetical protein
MIVSAVAGDHVVVCIIGVRPQIFEAIVTVIEYSEKGIQISMIDFFDDDGFVIALFVADRAKLLALPLILSEFCSRLGRRCKPCGRSG